MTTARDIDFTYTTLDPIFRLSMGQTGDYSAAMYEKDYSRSLTDAQRHKHAFIARELHIDQTSRVLDIGCGWGGFLTHAKSLGARGQGITLSHGQANACNRNGLHVALMDALHLTHQYQGQFDAISCMDSLAHACSLAQWQAGRQLQVYTQLIATIADLLPAGARFFLQTLVLGTRSVLSEQISLNAPKNSDAYALAQVLALFPDRLLPLTKMEVIRCALPNFQLVTVEDSQVDYIHTEIQWRRRFRKFTWRKYCHYLLRLPALINPQFRKLMLAIFFRNPVLECLQQHTLAHCRFTFQKI